MSEHPRPTTHTPRPTTHTPKREYLPGQSSQPGCLPATPCYVLCPQNMRKGVHARKGPYWGPLALKQQVPLSPPSTTPSTTPTASPRPPYDTAAFRLTLSLLRS